MGPAMSPAQCATKHGNFYNVTRRFGIRQGGHFESKAKTQQPLVEDGQRPPLAGVAAPATEVPTAADEAAASKGKVRGIDDHAESGTNAAAHRLQKIRLASIAQALLMTRALAIALQDPL